MSNSEKKEKIWNKLFQNHTIEQNDEVSQVEL